jgi:hypothetical protein
MVTIPMIIFSVLVLIVAMQNRLPKLLIPWIILGVVELFIVLIGCYLAMIIIAQEYQSKSYEKFLFVSFAFIALTGKCILFKFSFVFSIDEIEI